MVTREAEWNDAARAAILDLYEYESRLCDQCGFHESLHDPSNVYAPTVQVCTIAAGVERAQRELVESDEAWQRRQKDLPAAIRARLKWPGDGRSLGLRQLSPFEVESANSARRDQTKP